MKKNEFQLKMEQHLIEFKESHQYLPGVNPNKLWQYFEMSDGLYPPTKHGLLQYIYDNAISLHDYVDHVCSSQIFGFNLMYPIVTKEPDVLVKLFSDKLGFALSSLDSFSFEYSPEDNLLGEWKGESRPDEYVTSSDIALTFQQTDGRKCIVLVEFKFTEEFFGGCNGYISNGNESRQYCNDRNEIFQDLNKCYLQRTAHGRSARTYLNKFTNLSIDFPGLLENTKCPFIDNHQCLRNHSFALAMRNNKRSDYPANTFFCLVHHDDNKCIEQEWKKYLDLVSDPLRRDLRAIKASEIVKRSLDKTYKRYFKQRYLIEA